ALLPEDHLLEPQQRDLLFLQLAHQVEQASQQPGNHSFILLAQCVLLDFFDQGFDFGRIDFGYLVVRFSHLSYLYSERHDLWPIFSIYGAELSRLILSSLISEVTHHCRSFTEYTLPASLKVRLIRVELEDGEIEVLGTSLLDRARYPRAEFKQVYGYRWNEETWLRRLKSVFELERFSGTSSLAIE